MIACGRQFRERGLFMKGAKQTTSSSETEVTCRRRNRRQALALGGAAAAAAAVASFLVLLTLPSSVATADEPVEVRFSGCLGNRQVPVRAGVDINLTWGWVAQSRGLVTAFLTAADWYVAVDGTEIPNANDLFGPIVKYPDGDARGPSRFLTLYTYPLPSLEEGEAYAIDWSLAFTHPIISGRDTDAGGLDRYERGAYMGDSCTIVAVPSPVALAVADLASRLTIPEYQVALLEAREVAWSDSCLGVDYPGHVCLTVLTSGYWVRLQALGTEFIYHTDCGDTVIATDVAQAGGALIDSPPPPSPGACG